MVINEYQRFNRWETSCRSSCSDFNFWLSSVRRISEQVLMFDVTKNSNLNSIWKHFQKSGGNDKNILKTRKHSIRMHTTYFPTVSRGIPGPISGVGGGVGMRTHPPGHTHAPPDIPPQTYPPPPEGTWYQRCPPPGKEHGTRDTPFNRLTHTCENITFPQLLLWAVII